VSALPKRREVPARVPARRTEQLELPDGRILEPGVEVTVKGHGRFAFRYGWAGSELTCYGPVGSQEAMWRTFRADQVTRIHRTTTAKKGAA
jgi:hypothetical protein